MTREADVAVLGAGFAGLVCARDLVRHDLEVVVLEARDRVGGRTCNASIGDGKVVEVGGQWIGPGQDRIAALAEEVGVETFPTHTEGENLLFLDGQRAAYEGEFPPFGDETLVEIAEAIGAIESMAGEVPLEAPWSAPQAAAWDAKTFQTWIEEQTASPGARAMLDLLVGAVFTASPAELSLLHVAFYVASAGGLSPNLTDVEGGAQETRLVGGSVRIAERIAEELGERVVLGAPVRRVDQTADGAVVGADGLDVRARRVVCAVPTTVCDGIAFDPPLPPARAQLQRRMAGGSVIKVNVVYDQPFWRADGLSGRAVDPDGPVTITFDNSPPDGDPGVLMGFVEADHARALERMAPDEARKAVLDCLARSFGPKAAQPADYIEKRWDAEPWTRGCYGANLPPGGWTRYGYALREPCGLIHWAGAETSPVWVNYIEGAVRSGERAAAEILDALA